MRNLLLEQLDERAEMLTGRHKDLSMVEGVQHGDVDGIAFVGYHTGAGTEGVLAHTYLANSITGVWVNGEPASEGRLNALVVAEYGVPVVLVTGDDRDLRGRARLRAARRCTVAVKDYVSRYAAVCRPPARTAADITGRRRGGGRARGAVTSRRRRPVHRGGGVRRRAPGRRRHRRARASQRTGERRVAYTAPPCTRRSAPSRRSPRSSRQRWRSSMAEQHGSRPRGPTVAATTGRWRRWCASPPT